MIRWVEGIKGERERERKVFPSLFANEEVRIRDLKRPHTTNALIKSTFNFRNKTMSRAREFFPARHTHTHDKQYNAFIFFAFH